MEPRQWFEKTLEKYKDDLEYKTEVMQLEVIEQIATLLEEQGHSRAQLAKKLDCSSAYLTKLMNGAENLTLRKLVQLALAFNCALDVAFVPEQYQIHRSFVYSPRRIQETSFTETITILEATQQGC